MTFIWRNTFRSRSNSQSKEISNDQESIQSNPTARLQNKKYLTKVHETPQDKLNEQLFPKQKGHSVTLLIIKTLQIYLFYLFSILNTLNKLKYRCCCRFNVTKQKAECACRGVGGGGGGGGVKYKSKTLKSNLVEEVQLLALDGRLTWSSFLGLDTKYSKQRL